MHFSEAVPQLIPQLCLDSEGAKQYSVVHVVGKVILDGYSYPHWP